MRKFYFLFFFLGSALIAAAKDDVNKEDRNFKIISIILLVGALVLAIRKFKGTYRK